MRWGGNGLFKTSCSYFPLFKSQNSNTEERNKLMGRIFLMVPPPPVKFYCTHLLITIRHHAHTSLERSLLGFSSMKSPERVYHCLLLEVLWDCVACPRTHSLVLLHFRHSLKLNTQPIAPQLNALVGNLIQT